MPPTDIGLRTGRSLPHPERVSVCGWGAGSGVWVRRVSPESEEQLREALARWRSAPVRSRGAIARGMGRSYGDAAQLAGGLVLDTTRLRSFELDEEQGLVTAQAGVTIGELLRALVPAGWMVPVVPGTQHVSVGGAIASDIHGKNHGEAGTFGSHVRALALLCSNGEVVELEPGSEGGLFEATVGGMGLTGVILWARIALLPVSGPLLSVDTDRIDGIDGALEMLSAPGGAYRVAWLDLLGAGRGARLARGIVTRADHLGLAADARGASMLAGGRAASVAPDAQRATVAARAGIPARWPGGVLRPSTVRAFNAFRFRTAPRRRREHVEELGAHMFPLDALDAWPRLYGRAGLLQYQLAVPADQDRVLHAVIERLAKAHIPCYLAVLKDFGEANTAPLSFPIAGWTLALDMPRRAGGLLAVLDRCDELVIDAGGRVYLSKDARVAPGALAAMYPRMAEWQAIRERVDPDGMWRSDLALRVGLVADDRAG